MNIKNYFGVCLFCVSTFTLAQVEDPNTLDFKLLRQYDEINITKPENRYHDIKQISIGDSSSLSFGGSYRFQTEAFIHESFINNAAPTDYWFLHRGMWHAHLKLASKFEMFGELNTSLASHKEHTSPVDKDELNVNQLFAQYHFNPNWHLLVGRQNLRLGSGRLVDPREGPNVRLSFDMAEIGYHNDNMFITGFYAIPVQQKPGIFDNNSIDTNETLSALYWTQEWQKNTNTDVYVLYKNESNKTWNAGTDNDRRASIGVRTFGQWNGIDYNNEFIYQIGKFGNKDVYAWTASFDVAKQFLSPLPFTLGIKGEAISGDEREDDILNTFDGLYPRGAYFGRVAYIGPANLIDVHPYFRTSMDKLDFEFDYVAFWRYSTKDGIYGPSLLLDYPSENNEKFIANQIGGILTYTINKHLTLEMESNIIFPGEFLKQSNRDKTLYHFVFTTGFQF